VSFWESLRVAFAAIRANKLRSLLTMLGIIIGVGSVIIMIAIVQGQRQKVVKEFRSNGADLVFAFYAPKRETRRGGTFEGLTMDDARAVATRATLVKDVAPRIESSGRASLGKKTYNASVLGVDTNFPNVNAVDLDRGRFFDDAQVADWGKVCLLGDKVRNNLFEKGDEPVGRTITLEINGVKTPLTVIGTFVRKGNEGFGTSIDEQVVLPYTTVQKRLNGSQTINSINALAAESGGAEAAADQIFAILKQRHPENAQDFIIDTQEGLLKRLDTVLGALQIILGGVGGLSLLVGGIGIMNIMLVSVTERTREIGIRKAVGAKRGDILLQFVTESMVVSGVGGIIGVLFGYGVAAAIGTAAKEALPTYVPAWAGIMGFTFAVSVGMFFGIYPAFRAARLDPIDALRYE
jgi:putative ABC transport system permease protein